MFLSPSQTDQMDALDDGHRARHQALALMYHQLPELAATLSYLDGFSSDGDPLVHHGAVRLDHEEAAIQIAE